MSFHARRNTAKSAGINKAGLARAMFVFYAFESPFSKVKFPE
jgi:hypothetical protein